MIFTNITIEEWMGFLKTFQKPEDVWTCLEILFEDPVQPVSPGKEIIPIEDGIWLENVKLDGLKASATAVSVSGFVHQSARVHSSIDRGWVNGEYGEKMKKLEIKEALVWGLKDAALRSTEKCWVIA